IRRHLDKVAAKTAEVELRHKPADDFGGIPPGTFDQVILNSVIQYFPSVDYLLEVLKKALDALKPGGRIFIGDVRSLPLLETFHASVEFSHADAGTSKEQVRLRVKSRVSLEQELIVAPGFFIALKDHFPRIKHVELLVKYGNYTNELSKFRFDVMLHTCTGGVGGLEMENENPSAGETIRMDWKKDRVDLPTLRQILSAKEPGNLVLTDVPNGRIAIDVEVLAWLDGKHNVTTVGEFQNKLREIKNPGVDPELIRQMEKELPYHIIIALSTSGAAATYDVEFIHHRCVSGLPHRSAVISSSPPRSLRSYTNHPLLVKMSGTLIPQLHDFLQESLPAYMVPSQFVLLDSLPILPNGKLDRHALPEPVRNLPGAEKDIVEPTTGMEKFFAGIWKEVLHLDKVSIHHNFFGLGGDSINAIQVISRANKKSSQLSVQLLYRHQTIAELARAAEKIQPEKYGQQASDDLLAKIDLNEIYCQLLPGMEIEDIYPATPLQLHQVHYLENTPVSEPPIYIFQTKTGIPVQMQIEPRLMEKAFQAVSDANPFLRTFLVWKNLKEPLQVVCKKVKFDFIHEDFSDLSPAGQLEKFNRWMEEEWSESFDRGKHTPVRVRFARLAEKKYLYFFCGDYTRMDGWSLANFVAEGLQNYRILLSGGQIELSRGEIRLPGGQTMPKPPNCYKEFLYALKKQDEIAAKNYWQSVFKDYTPLPSLYNCPGNVTDREEGFTIEIHYLSAGTSAKMEQFVIAKQLRLSTLIQGLWALMIAHYTRQRKVIYGLVTTGRSIALENIEYMAGQSLNILPLLIEISPTQSFLEFLKKMWDIQTDWSRYENTPIEKIYGWCGLSHEKPMFDNYLVIQNIGSSLGEIRGAEKDPSKQEREDLIMYAKMEYPLRFDFLPGFEDCLYFQYYRRFFLYPVVKGLIDNFQHIIETVLEQPDQTVGELMNSIDTEKYKLYRDPNPAISFTPKK
ncbi:MAG TPA: condensation domain-containing protein, partial [Candidatus Deferrimicrobium sp.]|nr:condensation domain-containing protein [Candidatus Deferrimicrobium sp.]